MKDLRLGFEFFGRGWFSGIGNSCERKYSRVNRGRVGSESQPSLFGFSIKVGGREEFDKLYHSVKAGVVRETGVCAHRIIRDPVVSSLRS
jgi:hypothetical protein